MIGFSLICRHENVPGNVATVPLVTPLAHVVLSATSGLLFLSKLSTDDLWHLLGAFVSGFATAQHLPQSFCHDPPGALRLFL